MEEWHSELEMPCEEPFLFHSPLVNRLLGYVFNKVARPILLHLIELLEIHLLLDVLVKLLVFDVSLILLIILIELVIILVLLCLLEGLQLELFVQLLALQLSISKLCPFIVRGPVVI